MIKEPRFSIYNMTHDWKITLVGCGGTGSRLAEKIAELNFMLLNSNQPGIELTLIDFDIVELKNIGRQKFYINQVGMHKADAIAQNLSRMYGMRNIKTINSKFEDLKDKYDSDEIFICCVDNHSTRSFMYSKYTKKYIDNYLIDVGNERDFGQIFLSRRKELMHTFDLYGRSFLKKSNKESEFNCEDYSQQFKEQGHFINEAMALYTIELLKDFLINDMIEYNCIFVNLKEMNVKKSLKLCQ